MKTNIFVSLWVLFVLSISACVTAPVSQAPVVDSSQQQPVVERISLYWENTTEPHPERAAWSDELIKRVEEKFSSLDKAKDITDFCPKYSSLNHQDKLKAWGEIWVQTAYFESGFNPKSASVDVGSDSDKNTWSIGLWQMSVVDQEWSGGNLKYTYADLLTPGPNAHLAVTVMARQIDKKGLIVVSSGPYWAVLYRGKYSKVDEIQARVKKYAPKCK